MVLISASGLIEQLRRAQYLQGQHLTLRRSFENENYIICCQLSLSTYDHRVWRTGLPVRSAVLKPHAGRLVVGWVTTSESRLLYVFLFDCVVFVPLNVYLIQNQSLQLNLSEVDSGILTMDGNQRSLS